MMRGALQDFHSSWHTVSPTWPPYTVTSTFTCCAEPVTAYAVNCLPLSTLGRGMSFTYQALPPLILLWVQRLFTVHAHRSAWNEASKCHSVPEPHPIEICR